MTEILDRNIKDLIAEYPSLGSYLAGVGIACVACSAGTCRTRDIIDVHGLSEQRERAVLSHIAGVVWPGRAVEIPAVDRRRGGSAAGAPLSPPLAALVEEHTHIMGWLAMVPGVAAALRSGTSGAVEAARSGIAFLRGYADRFHHAKEEENLFARFDSALEIVKSMKAEHEAARGSVRRAAEALDRGDAAGAAVAADALEEHAGLLREHIRKEDEILFPWMDGKLSTSDVGHLYTAFAAIQDRMGAEAAQLRARLAAAGSAG